MIYGNGRRGFTLLTNLVIEPLMQFLLSSIANILANLGKAHLQSI